ncbi:DNA-directed RNA polymerase subunit L [Candidatus Alkanophaga liquidiphilum]|nr:DNA-directed RNA polymerase [Candidatus Alkanophaga liquidiphilum]RLG37883.1 MAG: DNA-directed RNA polymerase subunit L [Candidatus Alkanophagales archaeon]
MKILERREREIKIEFEGEDHTMMVPLRLVLLGDDAVEFATYDIKIPNISNPVLYLRTKPGSDPLVVLERAAENLISMLEGFERGFVRALKAKVGTED